MVRLHSRVFDKDRLRSHRSTLAGNLDDLLPIDNQAECSSHFALSQGEIVWLTGTSPDPGVRHIVVPSHNSRILAADALKCSQGDIHYAIEF